MAPVSRSEAALQWTSYLTLILIVVLYAFFALGCCMSPYWKGCGADEAAKESASQAIPPPAVNFRQVELAQANQAAEELRQLREFIRRNVPGAEIVITPPGQDMRPPWERLPFTWRDMLIWIKRPIVYDGPPMNRRMKESA